MLGNVAPAPLSFAWAAAGVATARAAASVSRGVFVMVSASSGLERELGLEQRLRAGRVDRRNLVVQVVPVDEHSQLRIDLVRRARDVASLAVPPHRLRHGIDPGDQRHPRAGHVIYAERAVDVPVLYGGARRAVLGD